MQKTGFIRIDTAVLAIKQIIVNQAQDDRPTLIFLHEGLGSIAQWKDFPELVSNATGLNAYIYDRQGYGHSAPFERKREKDYLHIEAHKVLPELIDKLKIKKPLLIGHSDGGTIALLHATAFDPFAIICIAAHIFVEEKALKSIRDAQKDRENLIKKLKKYHGDKTETMFNAWADIWLQPKFHDWNIESALNQISCPALIIQGENDEYATTEHAKRIKKGIGENSSVVIIDDCEHSPHLASKSETLQHVVDFIENLASE